MKRQRRQRIGKPQNVFAGIPHKLGGMRTAAKDQPRDRHGHKRTGRIAKRFDANLPRPPSTSSWRLP